MTPERNRVAQCEGKEPYHTRGLADRVAKRRNRNGLGVEVYRCPHRGSWHMGHLPRTVSKKA